MFCIPNTNNHLCMPIKKKALSSLIFKLPLVIYPVNLECFFGCSDVQVDDYIKKHYNLSNWNLSLRNSDGLFSASDDGVFIIRTRNIPKCPYDFSVLQHELFHAVVNILDRVGIKFSFDSEESYSYLFSYITKKIYEKLNIVIK